MIYVTKEELDDDLMVLENVSCHQCGLPALYMNLTKGEVVHKTRYATRCLTGYNGNNGAAMGVARAFFNTPYA